MPETYYGGPYLHESAKIEAELLRAHNADEHPDLWKLFPDQISEGAVQLIKTHLEGHPNKGYEGERAFATSEAHGVEPLVLPHNQYKLPGDGGVNVLDNETEENYGPGPSAPSVEEK